MQCDYIGNSITIHPETISAVAFPLYIAESFQVIHVLVKILVVAEIFEDVFLFYPVYPNGIVPQHFKKNELMLSVYH
jgi:hypothetical protein